MNRNNPKTTGHKKRKNNNRKKGRKTPSIRKLIRQGTHMAPNALTVSSAMCYCPKILNPITVKN